MIIKGTFGKKIYLYLIGLTFLIVAIVCGLSFLGVYKMFSWQDLLFITACYFMMSLIIYIGVFISPLSKIIDEIKAVLAHRKYKRIYTNRTDEIGILAHFFNEVTEGLEKVTDELAESKKISGELQTAGQLQKELLPDVAPMIEGFDIAVKNRSAEELGGDNLDFVKIGNSTYFYIGDVTGHGVPAAIIMTMVNTLIDTFVEIYDNAYEVVVQTNKRLKKRIRSTMFMSMILMKWDGIKNQMSYVGCGHEHILIYRAATGVVDCFPSGGIALGMIVDNSKIVKESSIDLSPGDVLVLYTDGITEARNMSGEMFGLERLKNSLIQYGGQGGAMNIIQNIARDFSKFVEEHVQEDDVTLMVLRKLEAGQQAHSFIDQKQERWTDEKNFDHETA